MQLGADRGERGIIGDWGAVDDKARAWKRLKDCIQRGIVDPVMSPGEPRTQDQRHAVDRDHIGETRAELAAGIAPIHGVEAQPETAAAEIGLAVARSMERLRLESGVRRKLELTYARWHDEAIAALKASTNRLALGDQLTEREAVGGE